MCSLLHADKVTIKDVCVWCSGVYHLKMPGYLVQTEDRLMGTESLDVGHKLKTTAWWGDQSAPVCSPHTIKTVSVWMFQHGVSEKRRPPHRTPTTTPIAVGLLIRLDHFNSSVSRSNVVKSPYYTTMWQHLCVFSEFSHQGVTVIQATWRSCSPPSSLLRDLVQMETTFFAFFSSQCWLLNVTEVTLFGNDDTVRPRRSFHVHALTQLPRATMANCCVTVWRSVSS